MESVGCIKNEVIMFVFQLYFHVGSVIMIITGPLIWMDIYFVL